MNVTEQIAAVESIVGCSIELMPRAKPAFVRVLGVLTQEADTKHRAHRNVGGTDRQAEPGGDQYGDSG